MSARKRISGTNGSLYWSGSRRERAALGVLQQALLPAGQSLTANLRYIRNLAATQPLATPTIFASLVVEGGAWDYKRQGSTYQIGGNFNYGATGRATGVSEDALIRAAGTVQWLTGGTSLEYGTPFDAEGPYGDLNSAPYYDTWAIQLGFAWERFVR